MLLEKGIGSKFSLSLKERKNKMKTFLGILIPGLRIRNREEFLPRIESEKIRSSELEEREREMGSSERKKD